MSLDSFHLGVKAIIRNRKGEILLLKVNPDELERYTGPAYWDLPGGRIHKGETMEDALRRELKEETGITSAKNLKLFSISLSNQRIPTSTGDVGLILATFLCGADSGGKITISKEHTDVKWFSSKKAAELLQVKYPEEFTEKLSALR
jgi:mutator protein MutT